MLQILLMFSMLTLSTSFAQADCEPTDKIYMEEDDVAGTILPLVYECLPQDLEGKICIYRDGKLASIEGLLGEAYLSSSDFYRRSVKNSEGTEKITLRTGFWESVLDDQKLHFELDKKTGQAQLEVTKKGFDPYEGKVPEENQAIILNCRHR